MSRRRRPWWPLAVAPAAALGGALVVSILARGPDDAGLADRERTPVTFEVGPRTLRSVMTLTARAGLRDRYDVVVPAPVEGQRSVVTGRRVEPGGSIGDCEEVASVSDRPIIAVRGSLAPYRDLRPGDTGPDVAQVQSALAACGLRVTDQPGRFGPTTGSAVAALYARLGRTPRTTQGSLADLLQHRAELDAAEATARRAAASAGGDVTPELATARSAIAAFDRTEGVILPIRELAVVGSLPARVVSVGAAVGSVVLEGDSIALLESGPLLVDAPVSESQRAQLRVGQNAVIGSAGGVPATVAEIVASKAPAGDADGGSTATDSRWSVRFEPLASFDPGPPDEGSSDLIVAVDLIAPHDAKLVVPRSAVIADGDGSARVVVVDGERRRSVDVVLGDSVGGWVEVRPGGELRRGDTVVLGAGGR